MTRRGGGRRSHGIGTSGAPGDTASRLLAHIASLEEADTTRREHLRANPQVLQQIREIDRHLGERRRTLGRLNAAVRQHQTSPSVDTGPQILARDPVRSLLGTPSSSDSALGAQGEDTARHNAARQ
jgi:hypothetical protein